MYEELPKHSKDILVSTAAKRQGLVHDLVSEVFQFQGIAQDLWGIKQLLCIYLRPVKELIEKNFSQQVQSRVSKKASQVATTTSIMLSLSSTLSSLSSSSMASFNTGQSISSSTVSSVTESQSHTKKHKLEAEQKISILEKGNEKGKKPKLKDATGNSSSLQPTNDGSP